ncbi:MAG: hypothetical protein HFG41_07315 [Coprococcus sp.]|nr:hypothetical protein [Coprococcus sp.]
MQNSENIEGKQRKEWKIITAFATVLIVIVAGFFIGRGFLGNPLKGTWRQEDTDMTLEIGSGGRAYLVWEGALEGQELTMDLEYTLDKSTKEITIRAESEEILKAAKEFSGDVSSAEVASTISQLTTSFHYSVDGKELTMTEWDYGEQLFFTKVK